MTLDTSTANCLLTLVVALQAWIIRELFRVKLKVSIILAHCKYCKANNEYDTDRITNKA
jgi:hypothetical protein